jgi:hypothetical protein
MYGYLTLRRLGFELFAGEIIYVKMPYLIGFFDVADLKLAYFLNVVRLTRMESLEFI